MFPDAENKYRGRLLQDPPQLLDRVNTPWDTLPDLESYNARAYNRIVRALENLRRLRRQTAAPPSQGLLILGEAGTGKTHLLMRVAKNLSGSNHILFVRRPNNEEAVAQHIWKNIVDSLSQKLPATDGERSQLDDLLAHVFSNVLIPTFEEDIAAGKNAALRRRWIARLQSDPYNLFHMLGHGEQRTKNLRAIRKRTLRFLREKAPGVDQEIAGVLITYCLVADQDRKRTLLSWLAGQDIDGAEAQALGLRPSWVGIEENTPDAAVWQQREEIALRAISSVAHLSSFYQPLILAFDQLEGLRDQERLTVRWGDVLREIFTMSPNYLILTCVFPSLWSEWFSKVLDRSVLERIAQQRVELDQFGPEHGMQMLAIHLRESFRKHNLPTEIYPFEEWDISRLCERADSPRAFLQAVHAELDNWLDQTPTTLRPSAFATRPVTQADIESTINRAVANLMEQAKREYDRSILSPEDFFGRIKNLITLLVRNCGQKIVIDKATYRSLVMPFNLLLIPAENTPRLCIAVLNSEAFPLTARLRNLLRNANEVHQFDKLIMIRDRRLRRPGPRGQEYLDSLMAWGSVMVWADKDEIVTINALYDTLVAVEQRDLAIEQRRIEPSDLVAYWQNSDLLLRSELFRCLAEVFPFLLPNAKMNTLPRIAPGPSLQELRPPAKPRDEGRGVAWGQQRPRSPVSLTPAADHRAGPLAPHLESPTESSHSVPSSHGSSENPERPVTVLIGDKSLASPHVAVLGSFVKDGRRLAISLTKPQGIVLVGYMGSGKSYALGVLIESALLAQAPLIRQTRPTAVVAFNYRTNPFARFEYSGYAVPNSQKTEVEALARDYAGKPMAIPSVTVLAYERELPRRETDYGGLRKFPLQFRPAELTAIHWEILMKTPDRETEYMNVIRDIIQKLHYQERLTIENLEHEVETDQRLSPLQQKRARNRLIFARQWISDRRPYEWSEILQEGSLTIVDLRMQMLQPSDALSLCLVTTDLIRCTKNGVNKMVVFDEAHEYVHSKELVQDLENALTQIRHDGMSFIFASQYPTRIPSTIFRYLLTRFMFKIPDQKEIDHLRNVAPSLQALAPQALAGLDLEQGLCFVQTDDDCSDPNLRTPQIVRIRPRCTLHSGATVRQL